MSTPAKLEVAQFAILIVSIILHEISHGLAALGLGDDTAKRAGRLTLNPLAHLDPIGSVLLPAVLILSGSGVLFGYAKPVPVNVSRLRHPRNDAVLTGLAGPAMNLLLVGIMYVVLRTAHPETYWPANLLLYAGLINLWLAIFNLIPIPPLDGSSVVERFIPDRLWGQYLAIRPYTLLVVFAVVIVGDQTGTFAHAVNNLEDHWLRATGYG